MKKRYLLILLTLVVSGSVIISNKLYNKFEDNNKPVIINEDINLKESTKNNEEANNNIEKIVESGYEDLEKFLDEEANNKRFQGVALVSEGDNIVFAKAYGYADENRKNEHTTRFPIASNTKQFTAAAVMQLVESNKINLDETIDKYFPDYKHGSKITIKNLLQMRSGIPDYLNELDLFMTDEDTLSMLKEYEANSYYDKYVEDVRWSSEVILKNMYLTELKFEPGEFYDYSNTNYYLLGLIIEKVSGLSFEDYLNDNIFKPCKMTSSSTTGEKMDAKGHGSHESGEIVANPELTYAAGNIYSNIFDMFKWSRMLHKGNIISRDSYNQMITPVDEYGYGLFINDNIIRHSGVIDGFTSNMEYDIDKDRTIIVLENNSPDTEYLDAQYHTQLIRTYLD